jgi:hypothetical protein
MCGAAFAGMAAASGRQSEAVGCSQLRGVVLRPAACHPGESFMGTCAVAHPPLCACMPLCSTTVVAVCHSVPRGPRRAAGSVQEAQVSKHFIAAAVAHAALARLPSVCRLPAVWFTYCLTSLLELRS